MPEQKELAISSLSLAYVNGQEYGGLPNYKTVRLTRESEEICTRIINLGKSFDKRIRSQSECKRCNEVIKTLKDCIKEVRFLQKEHRAPVVKIAAQIDAATEPVITNLLEQVNALDRRLTTWLQEVEEGKKIEQERQARQIQELELKAKIDSNEEVRRQSQVQAKQLKEDFKTERKIEPKISGIQKFQVPIIEIENRVLAAKLSPEAVYMEPQVNWFKAKIREARDMGLPIPTFPGIKITFEDHIRHV